MCGTAALGCVFDCKRPWAALPLLALLLLVSGCATPPPARPYSPPSEALESQMLTLINRERGAHGLQPLRLDTRLASAAREHTYVLRRKIERSGQAGFQHQGSCGDRIGRVGYEWESCGENIAYGKNQSLAELHAALLESPEHRANLLSDKFRDVGIGIEQSVDEMWITQDFAAPRSP